LFESKLKRVVARDWKLLSMWTKITFGKRDMHIPWNNILWTRIFYVLYFVKYKNFIFKI